MFVVAAFYQFRTISHPLELKDKVQDFLAKQNIKGTMILAHEGINATVCGERWAIDELKEFLIEVGFDSLEYKESKSEQVPFKRLKVHFKKEIVTLGLEVKSPGTYVEPKDWNKLISNPEFTVLDVRNDFEVAMGTFKNAINPKTKVFSDFPNFVKENLSLENNQKIAMSCTGGIRCEKASAYMKDLGFEVFHLKGGILKYLEEVKEDSLWQGECFVFDERVSVDKDLKPKVYARCKSCGQPLKDKCTCKAGVG